ncbi:MAG: hypothetical protein NW223_07655 [Hyphomicrobiaceae bacterium]|nr:hypothetical protein [Hyphomicrobiaceae bacterium]
MARASDLHIDIDLEHARREAARIKALLEALRRRHDLARYEYTRVVRIVPGGDTFAHPVLTLGNRFADSEDQLLSTYLHEQMHWYLWLLGTPDVDVVAPFMDDLVRRHPHAPVTLPDGARNYEATYVHLVVNFLEIAALSEFVGRERALALAQAQRSYRWIYRTVIADWAWLEALLTRHGLLPIRPAHELIAAQAPRTSGGTRKTRARSRPRASPRSRPGSRGRGGRSAG